MSCANKTTRQVITLSSFKGGLSFLEHSEYFSFKFHLNHIKGRAISFTTEPFKVVLERQTHVDFRLVLYFLVHLL